MSIWYNKHRYFCTCGLLGFVHSSYMAATPLRHASMFYFISEIHHNLLVSTYRHYCASHFD